MGTNTTTSYLDPPQLIGRPNADGTISLTPLELKRLNDYNYYVAKMLQGGLNLANLNEATNQTFEDTNGNVAELALTAAGLQLDVSNLAGDLTSLSVTVDGMRIADETGSYTIIDGGKMESKSTGGYYATIHDGTIELYADPYDPSTSLPKASFNIYSGSVILQNMFSDFPLKIFGVGNMSIDASGKVYIGTASAASGNVDIGKAGGTVNLIGTVLKNGSALGAAVFS